jgi:predicted aspartyl protease
MPKTAQFARLKARNLSPNDLDAALDWAGHVLPNREHIRLLEESLVKLPPDSESAKRWRDHIERDKVLGDRIPSELATPYQEYEIPLSQLLYTARRLRGWGLKLIFNDKKPITLLLDTGATGVIVHERAAEQLGLERLGEGRATVHGIGDQESPNSFAALAKTMKVGALTLNNVRVQVAETKRIANEDGLIGSDVFEKFLISLDFPRGKMILQPYPGLTEPPDPAQPYDRKITADRKGFYVFYRFGHIMALPCKLNDVGPAMFVIDTGAAQNLASAEFARELTKVSRDSNSRIKGVSGKVDNVYVAREATIEFAGFRQRNQNVLSIETKRQSDNIGTEIAGFLGMPVLGLLKTTIDYRNGLVRFEYQPH